jgi:23S rRNA G2445 N2-methylase RlmL
VRFFATTIPGLGSLLIDEIGQGEQEFDGRADVVVLEAPGTEPPLHLRLAEDVFVEVGHAPRMQPMRDLTAALLAGDGLDRALSVFGAVRPLRASMTFRVITRVRSERDFQRTAFREELAATIAGARPRWRIADPAGIELWALETKRDGFRLGLRLTTAAYRQRGGRERERSGALRPVVAAAMVRLVGSPAGQALLDPCCGAGTVLNEADAVGWRAIGGDIDPTAVTAAIRNTPVPLVLADAARLPLPARSVGAVATNLPFGHKYRLPERPVRWFATLLHELERVTPAGAPLVFLVPEGSGWRVALERHGRPPRERVDIRLLGMETTIWQL